MERICVDLHADGIYRRYNLQKGLDLNNEFATRKYLPIRLTHLRGYSLQKQFPITPGIA